MIAAERIYRENKTPNSLSDFSNKKTNKKKRLNRRYARVNHLSIVLFILVIVLSGIISTGRVYAKSSNDNRVKMYKSVLIYSGDNFDTIAERYMTSDYSSVDKYISEVAGINSLSVASSLIPGNHIIIPYYVDEVPTLKITIEKCED